MNKQLLIIVFKINISGLSRTDTQQIMNSFMESSSLTFDEELKNDYIIREIFIPVHKGDNDVNIIYPLSTESYELKSYELINEINESMKNNDMSEDLKTNWKQLLRQLKIRNLEKYVE